MAVPLRFGMFWGAPLLAREFEDDDADPGHLNTTAGAEHKHAGAVAAVQAVSPAC
jgi:hypothetical protein